VRRWKRPFYKIRKKYLISILSAIFIYDGSVLPDSMKISLNPHVNNNKSRDTVLNKATTLSFPVPSYSLFTAI
jgi:hypothetical protein